MGIVTRAISPVAATRVVVIGLLLATALAGCGSVILQPAEPRPNYNRVACVGLQSAIESLSSGDPARIEAEWRTVSQEAAGATGQTIRDGIGLIAETMLGPNPPAVPEVPQAVTDACNAVG